MEGMAGLLLKPVTIVSGPRAALSNPLVPPIKGLPV